MTTFILHVPVTRATMDSIAAISPDPIAFCREAIRRAIKRDLKRRAREALFRSVGDDIADVPGALDDIASDQKRGEGGH